MDVPRDEVGVEKCKRKSYRRKYKLKVIQWYQDNGRKKGLTSRYFKVDRKRIHQWVNNEEKIRKQKQKTRKGKSGRKSLFPRAENLLFEEFDKKRKQGKEVNNNGLHQVNNSSYLIDGLLALVGDIKLHYGEKHTRHKKVRTMRDNQEWFS